MAKRPEFIKEIEGKRIGVVLSSGFFAFWAHAGFVKAIEEYDIEPVAYSGCSAGAIPAAFKAAGLRTDDILESFKDLNRHMFWDPDIPPRTLQSVLQGLKGFTGYLQGWKFRKMIKDALPVKRFQDCKTGLYIVATNLSENRPEVFTRGDIARAVHASGAVPFLFRSVNIKGRHYIDGALVDKAPVKVLLENEKLDGIIVNYIFSRSLKKEKNWFLERRFTPWHVYSHSFAIMRHQNFLDQVELARKEGVKVWVVAPELPSLGPFKMEKGKKTFNIGYRTAKRAFKRNEFINLRELRVKKKG